MLRSVERWDAASGAFVPAPDLPAAALGAQLYATAGAVALVGGLDNEGVACSRVYRQDPSSLQWSSMAALRTGRYLHGAASLGGNRWMVVGGCDGEVNPLDNVELIDTTGTNVEALPALPFATIEPVVERLPDGTVLVAGGYAEDLLSDAALLAPGGGGWAPAPPLPRPYAGGTSFVVDRRYIVSLGGSEDFEAAGTASAVCWDMRNAQWKTLPVSTRLGASAVVLHSGRVLVSGGLDVNGWPVDTCELYTFEPATLSCMVGPRPP